MKAQMLLSLTRSRGNMMLRGFNIREQTRQWQVLKRAAKSHVRSHANLAQSAITSGFGTSVLGDDESPGSGQRQRHGPPLEPKVAISREEAKYMARHKALNASNRAKPWEIIAQECGITAPLNDITEALERAGYIDARGSSREADPDRSARMSRSGERRQARRTNGPHRGASKEIMVSKQARKGVYPSVHGNTRPLTGTTTLQRRGTPQLPTERDEPDQARKQSQPVIKPQSASISESSPDRIEPVQAKKKALLALAPRVTRGTHSGKRHRQPRPYECKSCLGKYRKRSGLGAHWKRNPGCDPETRRSKAAKTVPKGTTTEWAPGASKNETIAGSSAHTPMMQMIFEISSREPTPEISG